MQLILLMLLATGLMAQEQPKVEFDGERGYINGKPCRCVPYDICDETLTIIPEKEEEIYKGREIDPRGSFNGEGCSHALERCCVDPEPAPELKGCGYRNPDGLDPLFKSANTREAHFGEFPWVVGVFESWAGGAQLGAGALIHPSVVITAGNVVHGHRGLGSLVIRAGEWNTLDTKEPMELQLRAVQDTLLHEEFTVTTPVHDVALLRLEVAVKLGEHINVICLPSANDNFSDAKGCFHNGWATEIAGYQPANIMQKQQTDVVSHGSCSALLNTALRRLSPSASEFRLHEAVTCAGRDNQASCDAKSGAPLTCPIGDNRYKLAGLASGGILCSLSGVPNIYAATNYLRPWVDAKMTAWGYETTGYTV